jgi:hypothetical protein
MESHVLELMAVRPRMITDFPEWMLPPEMEKRLMETKDLAIAEVAGRDSVAAAIRVARLRPLHAILPTIAYTGTEFGDWRVFLRQVDLMRDLLEPLGTKVLSPIVLGDPRFWRELCGSPAWRCFERFGFFSPCVGCHLYFHAVRIPLARRLGISLLISGERESHDGRIKVNQIPEALDAFARFTSRFGLSLILPLRHIRSGQEVQEIVGNDHPEVQEQVQCVLSGNYRDEAGKAPAVGEAVSRFLEEFALPLAEKTVRAYLREGRGWPPGTTCS